jgi:diketogulonate reductase-like aldo/keto reductase
MRTIDLPSGDLIPALGQGTWGMGEEPFRRDEEIAALQEGLDLEMTLVDTAEAYGGGGAERLVGEAIHHRRDEVFVVTKVLPGHADRTGTVLACERSLHRLRTDHIDLYLLHWRGLVPLDETVDAFTQLEEAGKIRNWGVSNFDTDDLAELTSRAGGKRVQTDQVLYNLARRGIEWDLLPPCQNAKLPIMAYSPFDHGGTILRNPAVDEVARRHDATPAQVALAWVLRQDGVNTIPKASTLRHTRENRGALDLQLTSADLTTLDRAFPPPNGPRPLQIL